MWLIFVTFGRGAKVSHLTAEGEALLGFFFRLFLATPQLTIQKLHFLIEFTVILDPVLDAEHVIGVGMGGKGGGMGKDGLSESCGTRQNGHSGGF